MNKVAEFVRVFVPLAIISAGIGGFLALYAMRDQKVRPPAEALAPLVDTVSVLEHTGTLDIDVDGVVVPHREIVLAAEVPGRVVTKSPQARAGKFVSAGEKLLELDGRDYQLEVDRLTKELSQADVQIRELDVQQENTRSLAGLAQEQLTLKRAELERYRELARTRVVTTTEIDRLKREELTSRDAQLRLENEISLLGVQRDRLVHARDLAGTMLQKARHDLERTSIAAPIDGVIVQDHVEQDSYVQAGTTLLTLEDTSQVEVRCMLRMEELHWLWRQSREATLGVARSTGGTMSDYQIPHTPATVTYTLGDCSYSWTGALSRYESLGLDERTRTVACRILVPSPRDVTAVAANGTGGPFVGPPALVRGMYVDILLHAQPQTLILKVPEQAIRPGNTVWRVRDGTLDLVKVNAAQLRDEYVLVESDGTTLRPGDKLVVSPLTVAYSGMPVREERAP